MKSSTLDQTHQISEPPKSEAEQLLSKEGTTGKILRNFARKPRLPSLSHQRREVGFRPGNNISFPFAGNEVHYTNAS